MRRRDFIKLLAGSAAAWPAAARAQQSDRMRLVGVLMTYPESDPDARSLVGAFRDALTKLGWKDNLRIELRWAASDADNIKRFAKELVDLRPDAILGQDTFAVTALARETRTIPIVFTTVADPIGSGFAASLAHPGGNITGFTTTDSALGGKWVELLKEIAPTTVRVAVLFNPKTSPFYKSYLPSLQTAASSFALQATTIPVDAADKIEGVIEEQARRPGGGLIALPDPFNTINRERIIALAARYRFPAIYYNRFFAKSGGLISYGIDFADSYRQAAGYIDRVLKGANPGDLPVQQPTKYELIVNVKTATALGLNVPAHLQQIADEVVE
jgi:ABC-type uncharacterized transport system substrate-binding protein